MKYLWADELNPKPIDVTAPQYFQKLFTWLDSKFADDKLFPITGNNFFFFFLHFILSSSSDIFSILCFSSGLSSDTSSSGDFPPKFESELKVMLKRMFRCYAHIYHSHLASIKSSGSEVNQYHQPREKKPNSNLVGTP